MFFNIFIILSRFAIHHGKHMANMSQWNSLQIGILNGSNVSTHWVSIGEVSVLDFKKVLTPGVFCSNFNLWNKSTATLCNSFALCNYMYLWDIIHCVNWRNEIKWKKLMIWSLTGWRVATIGRELVCFPCSLRHMYQRKVWITFINFTFIWIQIQTYRLFAKLSVYRNTN